MEEYAVFMNSPVKGISKETLETLGEVSSPFKTTSVRGSVKPGDEDVAVVLKRPITESREQQMKHQLKSFNALQGMVAKLVEQVGEQNVRLKELEPLIGEQNFRLRELDFWVKEVSMLPTFALCDMVKKYLLALNTKSRVQVRLNDLKHEFDQCLKVEKGRCEPCLYYCFLHGVLSSTQSTEKSEGNKTRSLDEVHKEIRGIGKDSLLDYLARYSECKESRDDSGHPGVGNVDKLRKLLNKTDEMLKSKSVCTPFDGEDWAALLELAVAYLRSTLKEKEVQADG